jgi:RND family efflux transporter MFP subunit
MNRAPWLIPLLLITAVAGCGRPQADGETVPAVAVAHVVVRTERALRQTAVQTVDGLGKCEALPDKLATLTPALEGRVEKILVQVGQPVAALQAIVELDGAIARADLAEKIATRDSLIASLELLKSLPRAEERRPLELAIDQVMTGVRKAETLVERLRPLYQRKEIADIQLLEAEENLKQARLQQQTAEAQLRSIMIGPRPQAVAEAQQKIAAADAIVGTARERLALLTIRAPIAGVLDSLTCHPGQTIAAGSAFGEVIDRRQVYATVWLPSRPSQWVRVGQEAEVLPADSPQNPRPAASGGTKAALGKVESIGEIIDAQTGNRPVRILVDNPPGGLAIGQTVEVSITVLRRDKVLTIPAAALSDSGPQRVVNVVRDGKLAVLHPQSITAYRNGVEIGGTDLRDGEMVVVEGAFNLPEGTLVDTEHAPPAAAPEGSP